jgi:uroporphyrinogen III methyltransferase/synthase
LSNHIRHRPNNPQGLASLTAQPAKSSGSVCLVGAGPGDRGLITVAGLDRLRRADVVVYDALANPALLDEAPSHALRIDAGKRAREHKLTQDQTNDLLVEHARAGRFVVRLKGGDPYLFGRGAEEAIHCASHGVACEVIAGVTAGIAAPMAAGIPVTHRQMASTVTFVTGHEDPTKPDTAIDYGALAGLVRAGGTLCFYMGVGRLAAISSSFAACGLPPDTPVAVIQWGTTPRQRSVRSTLATVADDVIRAGIGAPAIIVVGAVAAIDDPGLRHFEQRPLFGRRIVVTRTRQQTSELREQLEAMGAHVLEAPTIDVAFSPPAVELDLSGHDWLILTSANAVSWLAGWADARAIDARMLAGLKVACVGRATADALLAAMRVRADFVPEKSNGEGLARALISCHSMSGVRCLLLRGGLASPALPRLLRDAGAMVTEHTVYDTRRAAELPAAVHQALRDRAVDWVTFTSSSTATNLVEMLGDERSLLAQVRTASIGPMTSEAMRSHGLPVTVEAASPGVASLIDAIVAHESP